VRWLTTVHTHRSGERRAGVLGVAHLALVLVLASTPLTTQCTSLNRPILFLLLVRVTAGSQGAGG
jgi:hypothetical protein